MAANTTYVPKIPLTSFPIQNLSTGDWINLRLIRKVSVRLGKLLRNVDCTLWSRNRWHYICIVKTKKIPLLRVGQESGRPVMRPEAYAKVRARAVERKRMEYKRTFQRQDHQNLKELWGGGVTEKNKSKWPSGSALDKGMTSSVLQ